MKNKTLKGGNKMQNKYVYSFVALAIVAILGVSMISAFGFGKSFNADLTEEEKTELQEQREAMKTAIENNDFETWKSLMEQRITKMQSQLTEENFNKIVKRHEKMSEIKSAVQESRETGDWSKVEALKEEYRIEGEGFKRGFRTGKMNCPFSK